MRFKSPFQMRLLIPGTVRRSAISYLSSMICTSKVGHLFFSTLSLVTLCMVSNRRYSSLHTRALTMFPLLGICVIIFSVASSSLLQREARISNIRLLPASFNLPSPTASTLLPANTLPSTSLSVLPTSPFNASSNVINSLNTNGPILRCDRELGRGLTVASCVEAQSQLKTWLYGVSRSYITIGQPSYGVWDINEGIRFLSCEFTQKHCGLRITDERGREAADRVCASDVFVLPGEEGRLKAYDLVHASNVLMLYCVTSTGGPAAGSYGKIGNLRPLAYNLLFKSHILQSCRFPYNSNIR